MRCKGRAIKVRISAPLTIVGDDDFRSVEKERAGGRELWRVVRGVIRGNGAGEAGGWGRRRRLADTAGHDWLLKWAT